MILPIRRCKRSPRIHRLNRGWTVFIKFLVQRGTANATIACLRGCSSSARPCRQGIFNHFTYEVGYVALCYSRLPVGNFSPVPRLPLLVEEGSLRKLTWSAPDCVASCNVGLLTGATSPSSHYNASGVLNVARLGEGGVSRLARITK
jgi:hypothetical protein